MARSLVDKLKRGLFMTHTEFLDRVGESLRRPGPVEELHLDRVEEALISADTGVELFIELVDDLRTRVRTGELTTSDEIGLLGSAGLLATALVTSFFFWVP